MRNLDGIGVHGGVGAAKQYREHYRAARMGVTIRTDRGFVNVSKGTTQYARQAYVAGRETASAMLPVCYTQAAPPRGRSRRGPVRIPSQEPGERTGGCDVILGPYEAVVMAIIRFVKQYPGMTSEAISERAWSPRFEYFQ